jgi:hypothetical protein
MKPIRGNLRFPHSPLPMNAPKSLAHFVRDFVIVSFTTVLHNHYNTFLATSMSTHQHIQDIFHIYVDVDKYVPHRTCCAEFFFLYTLPI